MLLRKKYGRNSKENGSTHRKFESPALVEATVRPYCNVKVAQIFIVPVNTVYARLSLCQPSDPL